MKKWLLLAAVVVAQNVYADVGFDNFEDLQTSPYDETNNPNQTDLGASFNYYTSATDQYFDAGYWYAYSDADDGGSTYAVPEYMDDKEFEGGLDPNGFDGSCLHIKITHTDDSEYPFYGIGASLKEEGEYFDMSAMTALEFYAKGDGMMKAVMKTKEADVDFSSDWGDYDGNFELETSWTKYTISADDFEPSAYSDLAKTGMGFTSGANKAVGKLHFQTKDAKAGDVVDFYVDDIVIRGMDDSDFGSNGGSDVPEEEETPGDDTDKSLSFDNFENEVVSFAGDPTNADNQTDLGAYYNHYTSATDYYFGAGYWYAYNESDDGGTSFAQPDYLEDKEFEGGLEQGGNGGSDQCLHIEITHTGDVEYPYYGIGANLKEDGAYLDLSSMTALEFYAKGEGSMKVVMKTKEADSDFSADWGDYDGAFVLSSSWEKVTLSADDFEASMYSDLAKTGMGFSGGANKAVSKLHFQTMGAADGDVVDFYVDDIVMKGLDYAELTGLTSEEEEEEETPDLDPSLSMSFDNFENEEVSFSGSDVNPDSQTDLGAYFNYYVSATDNYFDAGYWYAYNESDDGGSTYADPEYIEDKDFEGGLEQGGNGGSAQCLHIEITHTGDVDYPFYGIGANIKGDNEYFDMSRMTALEFYAKGEGSMKAVMKTEEATEDFSSDWGDYDGNFELESSWTKYSISADDFEASKWSILADDGMGFSAGANKAVGKLHFQTRDAKDGDVVDFYIDDIVIRGMEYIEFDEDYVKVAEMKEKNSSALKVYPNPAVNNITIESSVDGKIVIMDAQGKLIENVSNNKINVSRLKKGVYFAVVKNGKDLKAVKSFYKQ